MRLVSFNINGLRARLHQLEALTQRHRPAVIGLQETKVQDSEFPREAVEALGYRVIFHGQKGHYGVALMVDTAQCGEPEAVYYGFPDDAKTAQRRMIGVRLRGGDDRPLTVWNGYFPQGENVAHPTKFPHKRAFYAQLGRLLQESHRPNENLAVMGDFNISPRIAISASGRPTAGAGCGRARPASSRKSANGSRASRPGGWSTATGYATRRSTTASAGSTTAQRASTATPSGGCASTISWSANRWRPRCATRGSTTTCAAWRSPPTTPRCQPAGPLSPQRHRNS